MICRRGPGKTFYGKLLKGGDTMSKAEALREA